MKCIHMVAEVLKLMRKDHPSFGVGTLRSAGIKSAGASDSSCSLSFCTGATFSRCALCSWKVSTKFHGILCNELAHLCASCEEQLGLLLWRNNIDINA